METVVVSSNYRVLIPKAVRQAMGIRPGSKFQMFQFGDRLELVPVRAPQALRGVLKGMDWSLEREGDRL